MARGAPQGRPPGSQRPGSTGPMGRCSFLGGSYVYRTTLPEREAPHADRQDSGAGAEAGRRGGQRPGGDRGPSGPADRRCRPHAVSLPRALPPTLPRRGRAVRQGARLDRDPGRAAGGRPAQKQARRTVRERFRDAATLVANRGLSIAEASAQLGLGRSAVHCAIRRFPTFWQQELERARSERDREPPAKAPPPPPREPAPDVQQSIRRVVTLLAAGLTHNEAADQLGIRPGTIDSWQEVWREFWRRELNRAMETAVEIVRRQMGTTAVLDDPDTFLRQALVAESWVRGRGEELTPTLGRLPYRSSTAKSSRSGAWAQRDPRRSRATTAPSASGRC